MARKRSQGTLSNKVSKSVRKHKGDETNYGIIDLPGGIRNGIAQLTDCRFDKYKSGRMEGEYYFLAAGTVISPDHVQSNGSVVPVRGLRTQIMEPICDTTKANGDVVPEDEHIANVLNHMRLLGMDTEEMDDDGIEAAAETLKEAAPYFRFSTSQGEATKEYPNPRVWENWHGTKGLEDYAPESSNGVEIEDEEIEDDEEQDTDEELEDDEDEQEEEQEAEAEEDDYEELVPEKEEIYFYKPPRKRNKVEVEITAVFKKTEKVNCKDENDKIYKAVPWSALSTDPD